MPKMFRRSQFVMRARECCLLGIVSLAGLGCQGRYETEDSWVPIVAKLRRTVTERPAVGAPLEKEVWEGSFFRDSRGSELRKLEQIFPRPSQPTLRGTFVDRSGSQWRTYRLQFPKYSPLLSGTASGLPDPVASREQLISAGRQEDMVNGIPCFVVPSGIPGSGAGGFSGRGCYSPEYVLHLYLELDRTDADSGSTERTRTEFFDFQIGVVPATDQMCIPPDLVVQDTIYRTCPDRP